MMKRITTYLLLLIPFVGAGQIRNIRSMVQPATGPTISITPIFLNAFSNVTGTASTTQPIAVSWASLTTTLSVAAASGLQYSNNGGSSYTSTASFTGASGSGTVLVRVAAATAAGSYSGNISFSSTGATTQNCTYSATVSSSGSPTLNTSTSSLSGFSTTTGTASASQSFSLTGANLTVNATVSAPASWEVSPDNTNFSSGYTVTETGGTISTTPIYCRITAAASAGSPSGNVSISSTGATTVNVALSGTVSGSGGGKDSAKFNFDTVNVQSTGGWTNVTGSPNLAVKSGTAGNTGSISWTTGSTAYWFPYTGYCAGPNNGYTSSTLPVPANVLKDAWYSYQTGGSYSASSPKFIIGGLPTGNTYVVTVTGTIIVLGFNMSTDYRVLGDVLYGPTTVNCKANVNTVATWTVHPDASGNITIYADPSVGNNLAGWTFVTLYQQ